MHTLRFWAMNTDILLAVDGEGEQDVRLQQARLAIEEYERRFSRFLPESELSRLNASSGQWLDISDDLLDMLVLCRAYCQETAGLFDPSILPDLKRVGYDATLDEVRSRTDTRRPLEPRPERPPFSDMRLDLQSKRVRLPEGMQIDLGGIAKGWIVQETARRLRENAAGAAVSAGGDLYFSGAPADGSKWRVEIADPRDESRTAAVLHVDECAVVTSSISKRTWSKGGQTRHHIIDPRTGESAQAEWLSVTVVAPRADLAEAYAKAFLIGGKREASRLMLQRPRIAVISIAPDGSILASPNSKDYLNDRNHIFQLKQD
jgi:FAD:protein FMN transferase